MDLRFKEIPQMNEVIKKFAYPKYLIKEVGNQVIDEYRKKILQSDEEFTQEDILEEIKNRLENHSAYSLKTTINATGVILHTNLGRAVLSDRAIKRINEIAQSYSNLEYNIEKGDRSSRYNHLIEIIRKITKCEDAIIVNNNAAAVFLILNTFCKDKEVILSRGELVEIGDSFRVSEIMRQSGADLVEIGSTNRTHLKDYREAINEETSALIKVHTSNYKIMGFSEEVGANELKDLAKENDLYLFEDLGSGSLIDYSRFGLSYERTVQECIKDGVDLVSFSCDKMIGSAQGGIICGRKDLIEKIKKNQLLRAFRVGKLTLAAVEASLISYIDEKKAMEEIPTAKMITMSKDELKSRADKLYHMLEDINNIHIDLVESKAKVGGGAYPVDTLDSVAIRINDENTDKLEEYLRLSKYHIITTVHDQGLYLDLRTIFEKDYEKIKEVLEEYYG